MNNETNNTTPKHGEISWSDNSYSGKTEYKSSKDSFMRLKDGSNLIRVVTNPFQYLAHQGVKKVGESGTGRKFNCSKSLGSCPLCDAGHIPTMRWFFGVIDRPTDSYRILDASPQIYYQIKQYNEKTAVWGDPTKYDFDIIKAPQNKSNYYTVQPIPHKPLTPAEQKKRDEADLTELKRLSSPMELELMQKLLAKYIGDGEIYIPIPKEKDGVSAKAPKAAFLGNTTTKATPKVNVSVEEEDDSEFPPFEAETVAS